MNELLNCNVGCIFLTMGLPTLDPVMTSVLDYIHQHALFLGSWGGFSKSLGLILAMCVTSYECWMMMLGRRGIDVMKLFRIVGISLCIVSANAIADAVAVPGEQMGRVMKAQATRSHQRIDALEKHEAKLQSQYLDKLRAHNDSLDRKRRAEAKLSEDSHWWEEVAYAVKNMDNAVEQWAKEAAGSRCYRRDQDGRDHQYADSVYRRNHLSGHLFRYVTWSGLYDERSENLLSCSLCPEYRTTLGQCMEPMDQ